jgi:hypothetical protein
MRDWLEGGNIPTVISEFLFDPNRWNEITVRQRALYRATLALLMRHSPRDFHDGVPLSKPIIDGPAVDDHHIFPRAYLRHMGRDKIVDSVLNHTLIDKHTNMRIQGRPPSTYLAEMKQALGDELKDILRSHGLPSDEEGPLFSDDFEGFLRWRLSHLKNELSTVTGINLDEVERRDFRPESRRIDDLELRHEGPAGPLAWSSELAERLVSRISREARRALWVMATQGPAIPFERLKAQLGKTGFQMGGIMSSFGFAKNAGIPEPFVWDRAAEAYVIDIDTGAILRDALAQYERVPSMAGSVTSSTPTTGASKTGGSWSSSCPATTAIFLLPTSACASGC